MINNDLNEEPQDDVKDHNRQGVYKKGGEVGIALTEIGSANLDPEF